MVDIWLGRPTVRYTKLLDAIDNCRDELNEISKAIHEGVDLKEAVDKTFVALARCNATVSRFDSHERDGDER